MKPNLDRIPADGDRRAGMILRGLPAEISRAFLDSLRDSDWLILGRYGTRHATVALRTGSADHLRAALLATALAALLKDDDPRDLMVGLAIHVHVAQALGIEPSALFAEVADRVPAGNVTKLYRTFGARDDVSLKAFGWRLVDTPDGPDFVPDQ